MEEREHVATRDDNIVTSTPASPPVSEATQASTAPAAGTTPLRVGVAGAGFIGAVHARSARLAGATLAGVATSSPERS
jgi:threonine dehydrogenase-like Zn-dependent dehydrogenase